VLFAFTAYSEITTGNFFKVGNFFVLCFYSYTLSTDASIYLYRTCYVGLFSE